MLYLAADHRGFGLKEKIKQSLSEREVAFVDLGAFTYEPDDDFPDYAQKLAKKVLEEKDNLGVALCGSGIGMTIALNRFKGILAGLGFTPALVRAAREEDNINVLVLAADFLDEKTAVENLEVFLNTKFDEAERRLRRLKKIEVLT